MKIAFVGAFGYGNVGDDTYPLVFKEQFPEHELAFFNSDLPAALPDDVVVIVLGGGGILHNVGAELETTESPHFRCMKFYMDAAMEHGIPFGFLSCGFQFANGRDASCLDDLKPWAPYLQVARFITVRSPACQRIAAQLSGQSDIRFYPDAAYLFRPLVGSRGEPDNDIAIVPAGLVNPRNVFTNHMIRLFESARCRQIWLSLGAAVDDDAHLEEVRTRFPAAKIVRNPTPQEAFASIARSRFVMTGRYHGMVFARTCGVPFYMPEASPHKIVSEDLSIDPAAAIGHIRTLREVLSAL